MRIETDGDRVLVTFDETASYTTDNGMTVNSPCGLYSVQAIAAWQTLLGIDSVEDTIRAMFEANDTGSGEDTWAPVYEALEAALATPQARTLLAVTPAETPPTSSHKPAWSCAASSDSTPPSRRRRRHSRP